MADEIENWLPVPEWPEYEVSDLGRVRRVAGFGTRNRSGIVKASPRGRYMGVCLYRKTELGRIKLTVNVHVLVLRAFVGPPPEGHICDHGDTDRANNRLSNLEWVTHAENNRRAIANGRNFATGERQHRAKRPDVAAILVDHNQRVSERRIAKKYGISRGMVRDVLAGRHWSQKENQS